ncbi:hypothetical protein CN593_29315 [Bacillus pseudomycoides]|uniref:hypothetical protein n=1 Tax=Bacillus pseudomycoides TaxID=64104 RepID=UPI000BF00BBE|nr:hypothetical protein [Bacillus pseudomycoides]PEK58833.1 hypothetical protein CN593_29315 [Bacillus pseudomycoides]
MKTYKIKETVYFDNIDLDIEVTTIQGTEQDAFDFAENMDLKVFLHENHLEIVLNGQSQIILNSNREKYQFRICTKNIKPIPLSDIEKMTTHEKLALLQNVSYQITENDLEDVNWSFTEVYELLKETRLTKKVFKFDSLAYSVEIAS